MKLIGVVSALAVLLFYVLPKLISQLWLIAPDEDRIQKPKYHEPMRVEICGFMLVEQTNHKHFEFYDI